MKNTLTIKTTSGADKNGNGGTEFNYEIGETDILNIVGFLFSKALDDQEKNPDRVAKGGTIAQLLHAYGVNAAKLENYGGEVFPQEGQRFSEDNLSAWKEAFEFKKAKIKKTPAELAREKAIRELNAERLAVVDEFTSGKIAPDVMSAKLAAIAAKMPA